MQTSVLDRSVTGVAPIPAMTTDAERECYYRLAKEAGPGAIVELGAWMGASTAYIAAGIRDSGKDRKVLVYDHFISKTGHIRKVEEFYSKEGIDRVPVGPSLEAFTENLGPLNAYVSPHQCEIEKMVWGGQPIALLITDAPKRVRAISSVMTRLREALKPGAIMAWQDFCHFPSYEIPACLYRLRDHLEFVEAIVPGTTLVFRVKSQWSAEEVSQDALALKNNWNTVGVGQAWHYWLDYVPDEKRELFWCGASMFLCDIGCPDDAVGLLKQTPLEPILPKWRYLNDNRPDFLTRYAPLFQYLEGQGAL